MNLTIRERSDVGLAYLNVEYVGDSLGEFSAIAAREQRQPLLGDLFHVSSRLALGVTRQSGVSRRGWVKR